VPEHHHRGDQNEQYKSRRHHRVSADTAVLQPLAPVDSYWPRDILEFLLTTILERGAELATHLPVGIVGHADAAGLGDTFEPRRNVDAVAVNIAFLDDDVANMDADSEFDALVLRQRCVTLDHTVLNFNSTPCGVDGACELDQDTIAGSLDDATAMIRDLGFQEFASMSIDPGQRTFFVGSHQSAVTGDVARKNSGKPSIDPVFGHLDAPQKSP
jgi:hypothetical protein